MSMLPYHKYKELLLFRREPIPVVKDPTNACFWLVATAQVKHSRTISILQIAAWQSKRRPLYCIQEKVMSLVACVFDFRLVLDYSGTPVSVDGQTVPLNLHQYEFFYF